MDSQLDSHAGHAHRTETTVCVGRVGRRSGCPCLRHASEAIAEQLGGLRDLLPIVHTTSVWLLPAIRRHHLYGGHRLCHRDLNRPNPFRHGGDFRSVLEILVKQEGQG